MGSFAPILSASPACHEPPRGGVSGCTADWTPPIPL